MQQLLKDWRQDAMRKHQYESAIYIGDKLLAITSEHLTRSLHSRELTSTRRRQRCVIPCSSPLLYRQLHPRTKLPREAQSHRTQHLMPVSGSPLSDSAGQIRRGFVNTRRQEPDPPHHISKQDPTETTAYKWNATPREQARKGNREAGQDREERGEGQGESSGHQI